MYDEMIVEPMRRELTRLGIQETRTVADVDAVLGQKKGTVLLVVNSVCGCAAGMARPAVAMALESARERNAVPDKMITVFAGNDRDATARAREYLTGYRPSSPSIALFRDGEVVKMIERWQIEGREAHDVAADLAQALEQYCAATAA
ncbi:MAG TPA: BrxA/BrxB family bacilliredoxin [Thermoanaerobaculia bacterium]